MAAITAAVVAGAGLLMSVHGAQQQKKAAKQAGKLNAADAEENAQISMQRAAEDERQMRLTFRRDQASNEAQIGASGVKREGSPLEALQDNARMAENDAINIRRGGEIQRDSYLRQAKGYRQGARAAANAADISGAAGVLSGVGSYLKG